MLSRYSVNYLNFVLHSHNKNKFHPVKLVFIVHEFLMSIYQYIYN